MRARYLVGLATLAGALFLGPARASADEDDEQPVTKSERLEDAFLLLARGRETRAWELLQDKEAEARPLALERLRGEVGPELLGAARYLGAPTVWGKGDHPEWRDALPPRRSRLEAELAALEQRLESAALSSAERRRLSGERDALREQLATLWEAWGLLGVHETWKALGALLVADAPPHVLRGATAGLCGDRGGQEVLLKLLSQREFAQGEAPPPGPVEQALERALRGVARSSGAVKLIEAIERAPSTIAVAALADLRDPEARRAARRLLDRASEAHSPTQRAALAALAPRVDSASRSAILGELLGQDVDPRVRLAAAEAFGQLKPSEVEAQLPILVAALKDQSAIREAAGRSLVRLTRVKLPPRAEPWERWLQTQRGS